ncbi:UNVERIFIED_CONTAM: hypothetical protein GTU68_061938, partial [Idotea baltica]|nr:hypothetical protein [Idotea baltica]
MPYHLLKNVYTKRLLPCLLLGILLALPGTSSAEAVTTNILQPTKEQKKVSIDIVDLLENNHYSKPILNNRRSELIYSSYLKNLDPSHSYFTAIDVAGFDKWRDQFDDFLKEGKLQPGFTIYKRFLQRVEERLHYTIAQLNRGIETINFTTNETLLLDREKASWPKNTAALDNLWHKQLKDEILRQKLAGKNSIEIEKLLTKRYKRNLVRLKQTMTEDVFQSYMNAYVMSTDPHSSYLSPDSAANFDINMSLSLEGIGALLQNDNDNVKIVRLIPAGPAEKSKLLAPADKIIGVGQGKSGDIVDIVGWRLDEVVKLIRGPKNSVVRLEIIPANNAPNDLSSKVISITRDAVKLEDQAASKSILHIVKNHKSSKIGVITIPIFYLGTTRDVKKLIKELKAQHVDGIVIDLRNNGGGSLQEVTDLTGLFIKKGPAVVVRNSNGRDDLLTNKDNKIYYNGPMVVLVNRLSASASEIFAGAMQDYHRALIVGSQTFGKGTVQTIQPLD